MDFKLFLSVLLVYRSNFHLLHWQASGHEFHTQHDKSAEYYNKVLEDADTIAEVLMRLDYNPVNYIEAYSLLHDHSDHEFIVLPSEIKFSMKDFIEFSDVMFGDILLCIEELLQGEEMQEISNIGIKSKLEQMHDEYDLQKRYINKHRVCDCCNKKDTSEDIEEDISEID